MAAPHTKLDQNQILQKVYDNDNDRLRVTVEGLVIDPGTEQAVEIDARDGDSILIAGSDDGTFDGTPVPVTILPDGSLKTSASFTGTVNTQVVNPTDFRTVTVTASATKTPVTFSGFTMTSVSIFAPNSNEVTVRIGKSDVDTGTNYMLLSPGVSINLPLQASVSPVYYLLDAPGTAVLTILALGNP
jgi:hypothetical protein